MLAYKRWDKFCNVIDKAKEACKNSDIDVLDHFSHVGKMVELESGSQREIEDIMLSRYACYLIVQNADSR
ncbi:MAG: BRO family protein [Clostridium sp.]|uniref:BRO family protein n=1 Tax=Clostridium sp. TaxID=1506 RepID=UPI003D6C8975